MEVVLIGSLAINQHIPGFRENPGDVDLVMSYETFVKEWLPRQDTPKSVYPVNQGKKFFVEFADQPIHEIELAHPGTSAELLLLRSSTMPKRPIAQSGGRWNEYRVPSLNYLFTIKCSHRFKKNSVHFDKTMMDYHALLMLGCEVSDGVFLKLREQETYTESHPSLKQSKKNFFAGDMVPYVYDHDSIHWAVKRGDKPAYDYFKPETAEVMVSRKLFEALPLEIQLNSVIEEAYVLALERSQIPHGARITPRGSFEIALMKVCTSITSGWWRTFAYDHYYDVMKLYEAEGEDTYVKRLQAGIEAGVVVPHVG